MKNRRGTSIRTKILALYLIMTLVNVFVLIVIISDNQLDIIAENTRYKAREMLTGLSRGLKSQFSGARNATADQRLDAIRKVVSVRVKDFVISDENGRIVFSSSSNIAVPAGFTAGIQKAVANQEFTGEEYFLEVNPAGDSIDFYYPLASAGVNHLILYISYSLKQNRGQYTQFLNSIMLMVVLIIAVHTIVALYVYRLIIEPITRLRKSAEQISFGEYKTLIKVKRRDEIGMLAEDFNKMAGKISHTIGQLQQAKQTLEHMATTDDLTQLYNRRYFFTVLQSAYDLYVRYKQTFSLILIDLDWFKRVNDTYGHETGNIVLREFARILKTVCRNTDIVCRYGGEEFIILLLYTKLDGAAAAASKCRQAVEDARMTGENGQEIRITASFGVSEATQLGPGGEELYLEHLISAADQALYQAKNAGRNRVVVYESEQRPG